MLQQNSALVIYNSDFRISEILTPWSKFFLFFISTSHPNKEVWLQTSISRYMPAFTFLLGNYLDISYNAGTGLILENQQVQKWLVCWSNSTGWIVNTTILKHFPPQGGVIFQAALWCLSAKHPLSCSEAFQTQLLSMLACCDPGVSLL